MTILGDRVLVRRIEEPKAEGFQKVEVQDSFVYKGSVVALGTDCQFRIDISGKTILFAKYSPDTQEVDVDGEKMKVVARVDIIAVL